MSYNYFVWNNCTNHNSILSGYQLSLPINTEILISEDEPVVMLNAVLERLNYRKLTATYSRIGRIEYSPRHLFKIMVYAYFRGIYSSREIERACRENIHFMYLLEGRKVPDHNTISRFRKYHLSKCIEDLLNQLVEYLMEKGEISFSESAVFIDGTKIEADANKYSFVWKSATEKHREKLWNTIRKEVPIIQEEELLPEVETIDMAYLKELHSALETRKAERGIRFVSGTGSRKTPLQRSIEKVEVWIAKEERYSKYLKMIGDGRNSFSKTDPDATFMHMKEDYMRNGQLKPGYNVNVAAVSEYVVGSYISSDRTDVHTLIPFMEKLRKNYRVNRVVADSGYESEENYRYFEQHEQLSLFVKPLNHEILKTKKYRTDISRRENMPYDREKDCYICAEGKRLLPVKTKTCSSPSGFQIEKTVYECKNCFGCPRKNACILSRSKVPLEERNKRLEVSKYFSEQRERMEEKISSEEGKILRVNRSIQSEGVFAFVKEDMGFRRFLTRGIVNVATEWTLLSIAYDLQKFYFKKKNNRLGRHLILPDSA